jgi:hypothetical protein
MSWHNLDICHTLTLSAPLVFLITRLLWICSWLRRWGMRVAVHVASTAIRSEHELSLPWYTVLGRKTFLNIYRQQRKLRKALEQTRFGEFPRGISVHTIPVWHNIGTIKTIIARRIYVDRYVFQALCNKDKRNLHPHFLVHNYLSLSDTRLPPEDNTRVFEN